MPQLHKKQTNKQTKQKQFMTKTLPAAQKGQNVGEISLKSKAKGFR